MPTDHERFRRLTVEHALGGLSEPDAEPLRRHLRRCRDCRRRLHELRDLSEHLAAAERDERARRVQEAADRPGPADGGGRPDASVRWVVVVALLLAVLVGVGFYSLHLRTGQEALREAAQRQEEALSLLATGVEHPVRSETVDGAAAGDGQRLAIVLTDVPAAPSARRLVAWRHDDDGRAEALQAVTVGAQGELVAFTVEPGEAERVTLSLEDAPVSEPSDALAEIDLQGAGQPSPGQRSSGSSSK